MKLLILTVLGVIATAQAESALMKDFATANNKFAADVYKELLKSSSGNILVCPTSAEIVLALVHSGSGGQTAEQLASGLHLPQNKQTVQDIIKQFSPLLKSTEEYTLTTANKIYIKDGYKIQDQFKTTAVNVFNAEIQNIDFSKKQQAAGEMNKWVSDKTQNKIQNLIDADSLSKDTRTILINAMYFHGQWKSPFNKELNTKRDFYVNNDEHTETLMMQQTSEFKYFENSKLNAKFVEMPYAGNALTMTFVLPNEKQGLSALENNMEDVFTTPDYSVDEVHAVIPIFKTESKIKFNPILKALGVVDAFEDYADIKEIVDAESLKISKVIQKAFIEVNEEGTTAAAATYVEGVMTMSFIQKPEPKEFIADHPFIYYIKFGDVVLFAGKYSSP